MKKEIRNDPCRFLQMTVPLSPVLLPGQEVVQKTIRLRPDHALNLHEMNRVLIQSTLTTFNIDNKPWSLVSVYSPYSPDCHVMLMETSNRYLPSPEWVPDTEGGLLMKMWSHILHFIGDSKNTASFYVGYNWSPRSWGLEEERGGFQSIPTKWHAMLWGWPSFPEPDEETPYAKWLNKNDLPPRAYRIFYFNNYIDLLSTEMIQAMKTDGELSGFPPFSKWSNDARSIVIKLDHALLDLLTSPDFFSKGLKPLAERLNLFFSDLTEAFTDIRCKEMDFLLSQIENRVLSAKEVNSLRATPTIKSLPEIQNIFTEKGWSDKLLNVLIDPIKNRCLERGHHNFWWRKGFGYALVFKNNKNENHCELRILPGVYLGPGGVVEAQGVALKRLTDQTISDEEINRKSRLLWDLTAYLKKQFEPFKKPKGRE